jgi:hypothetical protein
MHAAAEGRLYSDIGGKPCLTEETGVLGPNTAGETEKAAFARTSLFSNWAHDLKGMFWWCGFDQLHLAFSPYNYGAVEQELGLFRTDRSPKPVLNEFRKFSSFIDSLPFRTLPARKTEAVCILTEGQDNWAAAYSSFILAKQAGFDFEFMKAGQPLKESELYIMPSVKGLDAIYKDTWYAVLDRVKEGATLYISLDFAYLPDPGRLGYEVKSNIQRRGSLKFRSVLNSGKLDFETFSERRLNIDPKDCRVLGSEADGNPAFLLSAYGKGRIYILTFPLEYNLAVTAGAFDKGMPEWYRIYSEFSASVSAERILTRNNASVGVTEHQVSENEKIIVLINYSSETAPCDLKIAMGWKAGKVLYGKGPFAARLSLAANDALVLVVTKN